MGKHNCFTRQCGDLRGNTLFPSRTVPGNVSRVIGSSHKKWSNGQISLGLDKLK
jgi:hypothetical protein